jgi:hypothetical protein
MRIYKIIFITFLVFTASCKSSKKYTDANYIKPLSSKKIIKKHISADFSKKTVDAKFKTKFNDGKINQTISVNLKMIKDEVIYLKGTRFITVFKAKITPNSVEYYSPFAKNYFKGDFTMLEKILGTDINFQQLQNLFLGQSIDNLKEKKYEASVNNNNNNNTYLLTPRTQTQLFDFFLFVNKDHFKLNKQSLVQPDKKQRLDISYNSYTFIEDEYFPETINIEAKKEKKSTKINFSLKSVVFDSEFTIPFSIPKNYKEIAL